MGKVCARTQTEGLFQVQLFNQSVAGVLAMFPLYLAKQQAYRIAVVSATEADLLLNDLACLIDCHGAQNTPKSPWIE